MTITIHAQGAERKRLVQTIFDWLGAPAKYCGAPTFNYEVDYFTINRNGSLSFDDHADSEVIERLLEHIYDEGSFISQRAVSTRCSLPMSATSTASTLTVWYSMNCTRSRTASSLMS